MKGWQPSKKYYATDSFAVSCFYECFNFGQLKKDPSHILISRTDSIGDVVLTLPVAKFLKDRFPETKISFLGKAYTRPVIEACIYVDEFVNADDFLNESIYSKTLTRLHHSCASCKDNCKAWRSN